VTLPRWTCDRSAAWRARTTCDTYVLTQDFEFRSPSRASAAMEGRTSNGTAEWRVKDGRTLKEL